MIGNTNIKEGSAFGEGGFLRGDSWIFVSIGVEKILLMNFRKSTYDLIKGGTGGEVSWRSFPEARRLSYILLRKDLDAIWP